MREYFQTGRRGRKTSRRCATGNGPSRKLHVERMEGRLMLSATTDGVQYLDTDTFGFDALVTSAQAGQWLSLRYSSLFDKFDGGLITTDSFDSIPREATNHHIPDIGLDTTTVLDEDTFTDSWSESATTNGSGTLSGFGNGIQPATIVQFDSNTSSEFTAVRSAGVAKTTTRSEEGGAISIPNLVAIIREEQGLATRDLASTSLAGASTESLTPAHEASSKSLAGEWARAAIFSMVGSERESAAVPVHYRLRTASSTDVEHRQDATARASETGQDGPVPAAANDAATSNKVPDRAEANSPRTDDSHGRTSLNALNPSINLVALHDDTQMPLAGLPLTAAMMQPIADARGAGTVSEKHAALAVAAAYDEIGTTSATSDRGSGVSSLWQRRGIAAPLLFVLAIERIVAINSRHGAKAGKAATGGREDSDNESRRRRWLI